MADARHINVCFHGVGRPARTLEAGEDRYWVTEPQFCAILDELTKWTSVDLSFDDGNESDIAVALPALRDRGLTARFFVLAGRLDTPGSLRAEDVKVLHEQGMVVGSHGLDHRPWRGMDPQTRDGELVEARQRIAAVTGAPVTEAACPLGRYDRRLLADLRRLGYQHVHTSDRRRSRPGAWLQPRYSVQSTDTVDSLRRTVLRPPSALATAKLAAVGLIKQAR